MNLTGRDVTLHDMSLRDGMHAKRHQITLDQMVDVATGLDDAGIPLIEVTHGDGLGGASVNYGFPLHSDEEYLKAVIPRMKSAKVSALLLPGIGTVDHIRMAADLGVSTLRVATHCTEADVGEQHIGVSCELGLDTVGFLMMAHMIEPDSIVEQARLFEQCGAQTVYVTDSAGYMLPDDVTARISAPARRVGARDGHRFSTDTTTSGWASPIRSPPIEAGAARIDGSAAGLGAGPGNTPLEILAAVLERMGAKTGVDIHALMAVAEERVVPLMDQPIRVDRDSLLLGYAGVYSSFLLHAKRASEKHGVPAADILLELGRQRYRRWAGRHDRRRRARNRARKGAPSERFRDRGEHQSIPRIGQGAKIHYHDAGEGPPIVLLHGSGPGGDRLEQLRRQHRRTFEALSHDRDRLPGLGKERARHSGGWSVGHRRADPPRRAWGREGCPRRKLDGRSDFDRLHCGLSRPRVAPDHDGDWVCWGERLHREH